ncbi:MAG: radical SAM protein [Rickettsiaceae bacterium]
MRTISLILKITERCNLNCSYCYYFNSLDKSFQSKPSIIPRNTLSQVIRFLSQGIRELNAQSLSIVLHGGEPLLMPKTYFINICEQIKQNLSPLVDNVKLSLQTNGVLIDEEWIKIFEHFDIQLGISLDGPQDYNDQYRVDHKNKGSYNKIIKSINLLKSHQFDFGILSVIDPERNPQLIYDHFINDLDLDSLSFLLPDFTHDNPPPYPVSKYGEFMISILHKWRMQDDPKIKIRFLNSYLNVFLGGNHLTYGHGLRLNDPDEIHLFVIRSNGDLQPTDELMSTDSTITFTGKNITNIKLKEFLEIGIFKELTYNFTHTPSNCSKCCWEKICGGGEIVNRFSKSNGFNNPSIYCEGLKLFYAEFLRYLIESGISIVAIKERLLS